MTEFPVTNHILPVEEWATHKMLTDAVIANAQHPNEIVEIFRDTMMAAMRVELRTMMVAGGHEKRQATGETRALYPRSGVWNAMKLWLSNDLAGAHWRPLRILGAIHIADRVDMVEITRNWSHDYEYNTRFCPHVAIPAGPRGGFATHMKWVEYGDIEEVPVDPAQL